MKEMPELPKSSDEYWEGSEKIEVTPIEIPLCKHTKDNYMEFNNYVDNGDGTISCTKCGWGFIRPGYLKVDEDGGIVDLRILARGASDKRA